MLTTQKNLECRPGAPIFTSDGKQIGKVKEVRGPYLKVDVRWARDYWLTSNEVYSADDSSVTLVIPRDELNLYKISKPGKGTDGQLGNAPDISSQRERIEQQMMQR
ncbi:MAG: hypothetical protein ACM3S1_15450 [Hyphomicrobiales bacterium]